MRRRNLNVFSLSFLDVMSCGFGAVVLIYLIINHATEEEIEAANKDLLAEIRMLDYQVQNGEEDLFELIEELEALKQRVDDSDEKLVTTTEELEATRREFEVLDKTTLAREQSLEELKSDVETREQELERLRAQAEANAGNKVRAVTGEGDRQYLTGLKIGGSHILVALDTSASMLDDNIVNVIRRRNMSEERQRTAPKWRRAVRTVEWIAAQLPLEASFQLYGVSAETRSLLPERQGEWIPLGEGRELEAALSTLDELTPGGGTNLDGLVDAINGLSPPPDNIYLIIDSLPTRGNAEPRRPTVAGRQRLELFNDAIRRLPAQIPVNVIMFPMEGDPMAAAAYWNLARTTGGAYMSPSRDWP